MSAAANRRWIIYAVLILVLCSPLVVLIKRAGGGPTVETEIVRPRLITSAVLASGTFLYNDQVRISPEVLGVVDKVLVSEGQNVAAGTPLVLIRSDTYESEVAQRQAALAAQQATRTQQQAILTNDRAKLVRLESLIAKGFVTRSALDDAREAFTSSAASVAVSRANVYQSAALLKLAKQNLRKTFITSTQAGRVVGITTRAGETVVPSSVNVPGSSLLTIADTNNVVAKINVDEADAGKVVQGQPVILTPTAYPDRQIPGIVLSIALSPGREDIKELGLPDTSTSQARTFSVTVQVQERYSAGLRAGMTCRAEIRWRSNVANTSIPVEAVRTANETPTGLQRQAFVFLLNDGVARKQMIALGASDDKYQAVGVGLRKGDVVIIGPARTLAVLVDGETVKTGHPAR